MHRKFPPPKKGKTGLMMQNVFACKILHSYHNVYMKKIVVFKDSHINVKHLRKRIRKTRITGAMKVSS